MPKKSAAHLVATALSLGVFALGPAPVHAYQWNKCVCLESESSPCTCTKNWKISPLATHSYYVMCDANGDGDSEFANAGYGMSWSVNGRAKNTSCSAVTTIKATQTVNGSSVKLTRTEAWRWCTNWSLTKKDSTSTVVTCTKE